MVVVYPNTYFVGMSNLGVHNIYRLLNQRSDTVCERAFLPDKKDLIEHRRTNTPILSVESQRPLNEFDLVLFSIAFENDFENIKTILDIANISKEKLVVGGAVATLDPELFKDMFHRVETGDFESAWSLTVSPSRSVIWTNETEFGSMHLVEVQRGCPNRCKFCSAPVIYSPFKQFSKEEIIEAIDFGLPHRKKIGLIGGDILAHKDFEEIAEYIHSKGAVFSPSSVRADRITPRIAELLKISGHKTITLAPEAGSFELRKNIGKNIPDEKFFRAVEILAEQGIKQIKLYFMIGLPGETDEDVEAIFRFVFALSRRGVKNPKIAVAVNPFVPKPNTPFKNEKFESTVSLKRKILFLKKLFAKIGGITLKAESPLSSLSEYELHKQ